MSLERAAVMALMVAAVPMFWLSIRLVIIWPLLVARDGGLADVMRRSFALTAGYALPIAGIILLFGLVYLLTTGVAQIAGGSVFLLIARAIGMPHLGHTLAAVLVSAVGGVLATVWTLFLALLYRRLDGSNTGT
jgi:membrane-anchored glycerophosphoryl diester phosphodiesterase (GDPDase)